MALQIAAFGAISLSELQTVDQSLTKEYFEENPEKLKEVLFGLGLDVYNYPVDEQHVQHRNRFGNIITTWRWVCNERIDRQWVTSGHATQAAIDKASGSRLLVDCYLQRGEVEVE